MMYTFLKLRWKKIKINERFSIKINFKAKNLFIVIL